MSTRKAETSTRGFQIFLPLDAQRVNSDHYVYRDRENRDILSTMSHDITTLPDKPLCRAILRALQERRRSRSDLARHLGLDRSTVAHMTRDREPTNEVVNQIEAWLGMARGRILVDAGYVDMMASAEDAIALDKRLTPTYERMAQLQYQACVAGSADERAMLANADPASRSAHLMAASS